MKKTVTAITLSLCFSAGLYAADAASKDSGSAYQFSTIQALTAGYYYGDTTVGEVLRHGDFGVGTFEGANGEMIVIDGKCYQALADGRVVEVGPSEKVPFTTVLFFKPDLTEKLSGPMTFGEFKKLHVPFIEKHGKNHLHAVRIKGKFKSVNVRAVTKQFPPYRTLDAVVKDSQHSFDYENISGTLIGLHAPSYVSGVNVPGWHLHFISDDFSKGGHVTDFTLTGDTVMEHGRTHKIRIDMPDTPAFNALELTGREKAVEVVEKGK